MDNICNGDVVTPNGQDNAHFNVTGPDASGNFHIELHYNTQGTQATGTNVMSPGVTFVYNNAATLDYIWNIDLPPGMEQTFVVDHHMIRKGNTPGVVLPGDDFFFHNNFHVTINAAGVPTASVDNLHWDCK